MTNDDDDTFSPDDDTHAVNGCVTMNASVWRTDFIGTRFDTGLIWVRDSFHRQTGPRRRVGNPMKETIPSTGLDELTYAAWDPVIAAPYVD